MSERERLVEAALSRKGTAGGSEFVAWYNRATGTRLGPAAPWCAIFVSWCARQAGIGADRLPNFAGCTTGRRLFQKLGVWRDRESWTPRRGDLVFFDWDGDPALSEHVGIVTGISGSWLSTVEGNAGAPGMVRERRYPKWSVNILGYAGWTEKEEDMTRAETEQLIDEAVAKLKTQLAPTVYRTAADVPPWGRDAVERLVAAGRLRGDGRGNLDLSYDLVRAIVLMEGVTAS